MTYGKVISPDGGRRRQRERFLAIGRDVVGGRFFVGDYQRRFVRGVVI